MSLSFSEVVTVRLPPGFQRKKKDLNGSKKTATVLCHLNLNATITGAN